MLKTRATPLKLVQKSYQLQGPYNEIKKFKIKLGKIELATWDRDTREGSKVSKSFLKTQLCLLKKDPNQSRAVRDEKKLLSHL